ncbi:HAD hydrolase-like protein [Microvirga tunisiensis]|uniref:HAD hydrolase-like protein n=1 Tax=Pannonibacter tanglangensis TaxID=2750084 RepID=A0A7X5F0I9_9HYPH|nr:HAD hydrolase-like protein [Pannonibacter sp. XCT-53]NBN77540.1 HAD hydrolase-like protein [Pannonibacter sp. XCT-53]
MTRGAKGIDTVLFDLDGTLTDPFVGITRSIQYALEKLGAPVPAAEELGWCIGPPLWESFAVLLGQDGETLDGESGEDKALLDRAVALYRERYTSVGLYENELIAGIAPLVEALTGAGFTLYVATSKPHAYAGKIVEHFGLMPQFRKVYGSELDGTRSAKAELIAHLIEQEARDAARCVMIGDRKHDLVGAHANDMRAIGVTWGYGSLEELAAEHPAFIARLPDEIRAWLSV